MIELDALYILGHMCEFLLFMYYANTSFYPRTSYIKANLISLCGYIVLCVIGVLGNVWINLSAFFIINCVLLIYGYNISLRNAAFYSLVLDTLSAIGEYIIMYLCGIRYNTSDWITPTLFQSLNVIIAGKLIYLTGIVFLKRFTDKKNTYDDNSEVVLMLILVLTIICLTIMMNSEIDDYIFLVFCAVMLLINCITVYINARVKEKNRKLKILQEEYNQNKAELSEYQLLSEKYENTRIMRHDFHKQLSVLKELIASDNIQAQEYMRQIQFSQRELDYSQYTDNRILNILLAQKVKECHKHGIEIHIHSKSPTLSFISELDTVAIFSNMLDNAIEASEYAERKEIYVDLYTVNNSYSAVKVENYTDKEPVILNGVLRTQKKNADTHGIGIKSINNALKKYNSELTWAYDKANKFFQSLVLIHTQQMPV